MESQLNPNAAEFVPVYGRISPTSDIDIVDISRSPAKPSELKNLENVVIPTPKDFYNEISKRPAEIDDLCETDATLNGGELNDISTKAVFGDDSITLNSAIDSSLVQSESLKSTNPFAPSQVPNFVQDHFSAPNVDFKPFNDSKPNDHEYDFMVENDKPDLLSPNEPTLEVYKSGQTDLSGIIFGDGVNVDDIVRSKQDSPLLRESPEPGLHNGQVDHEDKPLGLENATPLAQETDNLNINVSKEDISPSQPPKSPLPSEPVQEDCGKNISEIISEHALETPEIGPETSVDSESEDDVLVSPKIKERSLGGAEKPILVEDPICSLAPAHETDVIENSMTESALEMVDVYHKDDEEEDLICPLKQKAPESYFNSVSEAALESMQMPESASTDVTPDATSDFEIVNEHGEQFNSEAHLNSEEVCPMKLNDNEATSEQLSHPEEVKEVFSKVEVQEDLICPMKETPLLQESLKNSLENEGNAEELEEITANLESHESIPEQKIEIQLEKSVHEDIDVPQENKDVEEHLPLEKDTDAEETLVCSVKKESDNVFSSNRDEICHDEVGDHISHEEDLVCPINKKEDLVYEMERIEESVCSIKKDDISVSPVQKAVDDLFCPITKDDGDLVCSINKDDVDLICSTKKENDNLVCPIKNEIDDSVANKKDDTDLVCPVKEENDLVCPIRKEENDDSICPIKKEENDDLVCPIKKEENDDIVCPIKKEDNDDIVSPNKKEENDDLDLVSSIKKEENEAVFALEKDDLVCPIKKDTEELACPIKGDNDELVCPIKKEAEEVPSTIEKDDLVCPTKNEDELICPDSKEDTIQSFTNFDGSFTNEIHQNTNYEESIEAFKESSVTSELKEHVLSEVDDLVSPVKAAGDLSHEVVTNEKLVFASIAQPSKEEICRLSFGIHQSLDNTNEVCSKTHVTKIDSEFSLESSEKVTEEPLNNVEVSLEDAVVQNVGIVDEMSSSMIDHGEDKCLPEAQSNQLDLVQDLQFNEAHEKAEPDTESDSGFEIINASEASTIEMEMRIQSEKEAGAADEKLHLDKNEAEVQEKTEAVSERLQEDIKSEENERKTVEPVESKRPENEIVVNGASADTPATPPATPAPGLLVENKEGLIAAAVAAAGVATAVAGGTAVVKVAETKPEEKKKPPTPKKTEPTKTAPGAKPAAGKPSSGKPTAPAKAAAPKPSAPSAKLTSKPTSPATKTALAPAKPSSKPSTPTTKVPAKPTSKPSTPTGAKPATPTSSTALKSKPAAPAASKPAAPAASKPATTTSAATRTAAKPSSTLGAAKKPAPTPASKPASTGAKPAVSSTVGARPAAKLAAPASTLKSASPSAAKTLPTKPPTPTSKAPAAARPPSAKSAVPSKPPTSSAPTKAPPKPAPAKAPASKPPTTTSAKAAPASKTLAAKPTAPAKPSAAPLNKKPAAPTAIKKPAAPTDKSVKEANNKLASAKTAVKKVEDKKIVSKKEEIAENEIVLPTQEPVVTTTNGHITLIENGIPTPEIVAE
uniref:Uncharacterized protein n=1 Tax=Riptortus pedestris TaxID=329032 RepID=R4WE17_RIPPE|nr:hypothetical protein [Riptortus pedestris]